jgi:iron complex outermembrane receptor protein
MLVITVGGQRVAAAQQPTQPLDTVRVTSRTGVAAAEARSITVLGRDDIARTAARTVGDLIAVRLGTDLLTRSPASADIALRGASYEGVVILVDGVRMRDAQSGHFNLDLAVPTEAIERIEILRGTSSALYGADAVGGVINIVTRSGAAPIRSLTVGGGSFGSAAVEAMAAADLAGTRVSGAIDYSRSDGHRTGTDYRITQARGTMARNVSGGALKVNGGVGVRHFGAADFYGAYPAYEDTRTATAAANYDRGIGAGWWLTARADARRHGDLFTLRRNDPAFYQNRHVSWQSAEEVVVRRALSAETAVASGVSFEDFRLTSARLGNHTEQRRAWYTQATMSTGRASLDAGARLDWSSLRGSFFSPSIAGSLPVGGRTVLRASGARGFRAPTWTERYYVDPANVGNPNLSSELFWTGEAGLFAAITQRASFDGAVFVRRANDLVDWAKPIGAPDTTKWRTMNVDRATFRGVEAQVTVRDVAGADWTLHGSGLDLDASDAAGFRGKYALSPITKSLGLNTTFRLRRARLGVDGVGSRRVGEDARFTANARLTVPLRRTQLALDFFNLTNAGYRDVSGAPIAGRAVNVRLGWTGR